MLNRFGSSSSVSCQFLVVESPLIQVIFMIKHAKNLLFEGLCFNLKGLKLFSKTNFWIFLGVWRAENLIEYVFCATLLVSGIDPFVPPPLKVDITNSIECVSICLFVCPNQSLLISQYPPMLNPSYMGEGEIQLPRFGYFPLKSLVHHMWKLYLNSFFIFAKTLAF